MIGAHQKDSAPHQVTVNNGANNVDFVWLLDQDEFYSEEDIRGAINYIKNSEKVPTYKINFKNFVFSEDQYVDDFNPPRIFCANVNGQKTLSHFFYENDVMYNIDNKFIELYPTNKE